MTGQGEVYERHLERALTSSSCREDVELDVNETSTRDITWLLI